jgi:hypothetical protein
VLNRFFRCYLASHSQGGTNTKQRNLRHLFSWLAIEYGHPHPYTDGLVRYAPVKVRPSTLAADFIKDLLSTTGDGRARRAGRRRGPDRAADARDGQGDRDRLAGGGAEGDLMRLMGWQDRAMLDRYGADLQVQRAIEAKRRRGEMY